MDTRVDHKYLFIGGTGRSGTNITRKMFSLHPDVASIPFEYRFIIDPDGIIDFYQSITNAWSPFMADVKIKRLYSYLMNLAEKNPNKKNYKDWELAEWFPDYKENIKVLIDELKTFDYPGFWPGAIGDKSSYMISFSEYKNREKLSEILGRFLRKNIDNYIKINNKSIFVEDNTWNILFAKELSEIMPESRMLHLIRDPRDVIASFMEQRWCPNDFDRALKMYKSIMFKWFKVVEVLPENYCKLVKLEDLVKQPKAIIESICDFSDIPFNPKMLEIKLNKANEQRWKKTFTKENEKTAEKELENIFEKLTYS